MWKLSKDNLTSIGIFLLNIIITHFFFSIHDYYNTNPIIFIDYPRFLQFAWYLGEILIPQFGSTFGFSQALYMGYPIIHIYPPGIFYVIYFLHLFGLEYAVAIKILLFILLVMMGYFPFWASKQFNASFWGGLIGTLWIWFGLNSFWLSMIQQGLLPYYYGVLLSMVFLIKIKKKDFGNHKPFFTKDHFYCSFLICTIILLNFMAILFLAFICVVELLLWIKKDKRISMNIKNQLRFYIEICIIAFLFLCFWILPTLFIQFPYVSFDQKVPIFSFEYSFQSIFEYAISNIFSLIGIGIFIILLNLTKTIDPNIQYLTRIVVLSLILVLILPLISLNYFSGINTYRFIIFFELTISILISFFTDSIKKLFGKFRNLDASERASSMIKKKLTKKVLINISCIGFLVTELFLFNVPSSSYRAPYLGQFRTPDGTIIQAPSNLQALNLEDQKLINWINENTDKGSRILIQNSGDNTGFMHSNSHALGYLAMLTDRYYATGDIDHFWYRYSINSSFTDDILFGKSLINMTYEELFSYLELFNIQFIIIWSPIAKNYFEILCQFSNKIGFIQDSGDFVYYQYKKSKYSYVLVNPSTNVQDFSMNNTQITFSLSNFQPNEEIIVSMHDFTNWQIYINGTQIMKEINENGLIQFKIPNDFDDNVNVQIIWEKSTLEFLSDGISIVSFIGYLGILLIFFLKSKKSVN